MTDAERVEHAWNLVDRWRRERALCRHVKELAVVLGGVRCGECGGAGHRRAGPNRWALCPGCLGLGMKQP